VVTRGGATWDYSYAADNDTRLMGVTNLPLTVQSYDGRGNLTKYTKGGVVYQLTFDVENRLASVKVGTAQPTTFAYDADGQRVLTTQPDSDGTVIYTPFPDFEMADPPGAGGETFHR
jgi:YD repeat-containing protein